MKAVVKSAKKPAKKSAMKVARFDARYKATVHMDCRANKKADDNLEFKNPQTAKKPRYWRQCTVYNDRIRKLWRLFGCYSRELTLCRYHYLDLQIAANKQWQLTTVKDNQQQLAQLTATTTTNT